MRKIILLCLLYLSIISCSNSDTNSLGVVEKLPKGNYIIYNYGSRHIVRCEKSNGKYYYLNDYYFKQNGIPGYDAHQYRNKTKITIK